MTMTPISNSEMLNQFLEDQVQNGSINQSDNTPIPTNLPSPIQQAAPQTLLEQDIITNLLQQSNGDQLPQQINTQVLNSQPTNCAGLQGGNQLFNNLLKPPDASASPSNTPIQSVNLSERSITEVLQQMLSSSQPKMPQETAQAETVPMIATTYSCTNTSNSGLLNNVFSTEAVTMVTTNSITTGTFTANPPTSVPITNTCMVNVLSGDGNLIPVKTEPGPTGCQVACDFPVETCKAPHPSSTEPGNQSQQTTITTGIGNNVSSNDMKVVTSPMSGQQPRMDLPADLANVKLQMFSPVSSLPPGLLSTSPLLLKLDPSSPWPPPIQRPRKVKDTGLGAQFSARTQQYELRIVSQPEEQHRARYLTEGSRGAVKDRSQQAHPVIKLIGHSDTVCLQVFVGNETGRVKPHGFYQACKVCGKNSTPSKEKEIDGTVVIETEMTPSSEMTVSVDCVGILKLRNADVEKRIGVAKARAKKKNSTRARLIFRVTFQKPDGNFQTLQVASSPIICTQPVGQPEISRMSLEETPATGGQDLFIIGKNFLKGTQVKFQEISVENGKTLWEKEADIDQEYFQQTHLICKIPEYQQKSISKPILVQIVIHCRGKISDPQEFYYNPLPTQQVEVPMETDQSQSKNALPCVSPVALELNRLVERTQSSPSPNTSLFQLPPGTVDGITPMATVQQGIPTQAVQPFVKQEIVSTPMETSQQQQPQQQQPQLQTPQQTQLQPQQTPQLQTPQLQTPQQPQLANNVFGKTLLDLLNASNQQVPQTLQTGVNQPNSQIILVSNNGQTNSTAVATEAGVANQQIQGMMQSSPMIVILPGNTTNATGQVQAQATVNNIPMESILKSLLGHQTGPT
ncbi:nuclear factor of activated T-cells 5-like isoform X2 [Haliotis rubra]|uniref:nuclear factor of activated T-cells 5-like isoform X2 n=1 Tax=Haliotis rubra TaxID=36100 RepID=UPI001EE597FB|nr:nuclear factor of activated T-cells 5-like isoform X2 [Haliotis rubra]